MATVAKSVSNLTPKTERENFEAIEAFIDPDRHYSIQHLGRILHYGGEPDPIPQMQTIGNRAEYELRQAIGNGEVPGASDRLQFHSVDAHTTIRGFEFVDFCRIRGGFMLDADSRRLLARKLAREKDLAEIAAMPKPLSETVGQLIDQVRATEKQRHVNLFRERIAHLVSGPVEGRPKAIVGVLEVAGKLGYTNHGIEAAIAFCEKVIGWEIKYDGYMAASESRHADGVIEQLIKWRAEKPQYFDDGDDPPRLLRPVS